MQSPPKKLQGDIISRLKIMTASMNIAEKRVPQDGRIQVKVGDERRQVLAVENIITGERLPVEWGGIRLRIDPVRDPALLFRCMA